VPGYLYIYLSYENESQNWVYFDDLKVTYKKSQVVQSNNYYAFGMQTSESWTRTGTQPNKYLYNAGSELNGNTGNYEMFFREYDPALGRMNAIDPMASKYASLTPYNYSFNDPVTYNDPSGADPWDSGPYNGSMAYYYAVNFGAVSPGSETIIDPGGRSWNPGTAGGYGVAGAGFNPYYSAIRHMASTWSSNIMGPVNYIDMLGNSRWALPTVLETASRQAQRQLSVSITDGNLINAMWETLESGGAIVFTFNKSSILNGVFALWLRAIEQHSFIIASTATNKIACCPGDPRQQILWNSTTVDEWFERKMDELDLFWRGIKDKYQPDPEQIERAVEFFLEKALQYTPNGRWLKEIIPFVAPPPPPLVESKENKFKST
jgi:RHS repeat-associated protein